MQLFADLHIHSKYARACSKDITIQNLEKYSRIKGLNLLGTGDFTHPLWLKELKSNLVEDGTGILKTKTGFPFVLQTEVANFFRQDNNPRKVHSVILAKSFEVVSQINELFGKHGNLQADGRPMFASYPCVNMVEDLMEIDKSIEIIPGHILTPFFGILGSKSGFDSLEECYKEKTKYIHAVETGLSADPPMLWRLSFLDNITILSNSDSHSFWPWRIGRECNLFNLKEISYNNLINSIRTKSNLNATIEVDPSYGMYHFDGHRNCSISFSPQESIKHNNTCPICKKPLTIGVLHRIEELASRPENYMPANASKFYSMLPLAEVISLSNRTSLQSKRTQEIYNSLIQKFNSEFNILLNVQEFELSKLLDQKLTSLILKNREGKIQVKPGYDGVYGVPVIDGQSIKLENDSDNNKKENSETKNNKNQNQKSLSEF